MSKGSGFRGCLNYLAHGPKSTPRNPPGEIIGGNMSGRTPRELAAEFSAVRRLRPDVKRPLLQGSLALPPGEAETAENWNKAGRVWLEEMGLDPDKHPFVIYKHDDRDHQHVHIVASRIAIDGTLAREQRGDFKRSHAAAATAARAIGREPVPKPDPAARQPLMTKKDRAELDHGVTPARLAIAGRLDKALEQSTDWDDFKNRADALGVEITEVSNSGGIYGVKYRLENGDWLKGSQVGKAYSYASILRRLQAGGADLGAGAGPKSRKDILTRLQAEQTAAGTFYRWANGAIAVVDTGPSLRWRTGSTAEAAALAAVAQSKGWTSVHLGKRADPVTADAAWLEYMRRGVAVENHKPSEEVYAAYIRWRDGVDAKNETRAVRESTRASEQRDGDSSALHEDPRSGAPGDRNNCNKPTAEQGNGGAEQQNNETPSREKPIFSQEVAGLSGEDERVLWMGMHRTLERWARRAPSRAGEEIRKRLPVQVAELVKQEQDQNRRRQLIAQIAANAATQRPPRNLQDARDLLAATPRPGAVQSALAAAKDQYKPTFTPKPGQDINFEPGI